MEINGNIRLIIETNLRGSDVMRKQGLWVASMEGSDGIGTLTVSCSLKRVGRQRKNNAYYTAKEGYGANRMKKWLFNRT